MAFTATVIDATENNGQVAVTLEFTDGTSKVRQRFAARSFRDLKAQASAYAAQLITDGELRDVTLFAKALQPGATVAITAPPAPPPPMDPALVLFLEAVTASRQLDRAVALGVLSATDKLVTDARALVIARWNSSYLSMV